MKPGWSVDLSICTAGCTVELSGKTFETSLYSEGRRTATSVGRCGAGRQNRPAGRGDDPQPDLRGRLQGLLLRVPARSQPASGAGRADSGHPTEAGELGA